ncbi:MAG: hypothetical protein Q8N23_09885 [Archangium sp.]|nr:hypothetical protein [Archangium sp.]MDP3152968.1 hypothetical protein [Archangium sp.]MDP3569087.1 hypothetical protein [Archangium sp.]
MHIAAARSGLTKFHYEFFDERQQPVGTLDFPTGLATAKGSVMASVAPAAVQDQVRFRLPEGLCELEFTGPSHEVRFTLLREGKAVATALASGRNRLEVTHATREFHLTKRSSWLRLRFDVLEGPHVIGSIFEPDLFSLVRRRFVVELPREVPNEARALLFFLMVNSVFR